MFLYLLVSIEVTLGVTDADHSKVQLVEHFDGIPFTLTATYSTNILFKFLTLAYESIYTSGFEL